MTALPFLVVPTFHDRRSDLDFNFVPSPEEHLQSLYGTGHEGLQRMFGGNPTAPTPWKHAGMRKDRQMYDPGVVQRELAKPLTRARLREVDPRRLLASQSSLQRAGVAHYLGNQFRETGKTFQAEYSVGNVHPFVYSREKDGGQHEDIILGGHHRAAAALLRGEPLQARHVFGGWGPER